MSQAYRKRALRELTNEIGVYAPCDFDEVTIYVGQSVDGIRARVNRDLTSARSDIIANRQIDVWEIAYVKAWPLEDRNKINSLEAILFKAFDSRKSLMNGSIPPLTGELPKSVPRPSQTIQVMTADGIRARREPALRLPRQIEHIGRLVDHILNVKDSAQLGRSLAAHFARLDAYRSEFLQQRTPVIREPGAEDDAG